MKFKLGVYSILTTILLLNCGTTKDSMSPDQDAVVQAVFIYQMNHHPLKKGQQTYFLSVENNHDPDERLIEELKVKKYPVKLASQSQMSKGSIQDKESKAVGILLSIRHRTCLSSTRCSVEGSVYEDTDNIEVWLYEVAKENHVWVVKKAELITVT